MQTLLEVLAKHFPECSRNALRSFVDKGRVLVDGKLMTKTTHLVKDTQEVRLLPRKHFIDKELAILYEDRFLVIVDKPAGLLSVATHFDKENTVHAILKAKQRVFPVHRLDRETSGVICFAYTQEAQEGLKKQFENHSIEREYRALVEGKLNPTSGTWKCFLYEDESTYVVRPSPVGELAITHYETLKITKRFSLLKVTLETGKKNQIRVHCQMAKHPVVGDKKYGARTNPIRRLGLHAHKLGFIHPITKKRLCIESPIQWAL